MFLQKAFVLIIWCLIMRCLSKEGKWQWGNNNTGPSLNIMLFKKPSPSRVMPKSLISVKGAAKILFSYFIGGSRYFSNFLENHGSGSVQALGWLSLAAVSLLPSSGQSVSPSVTIRPFIPTFRTWHVPNCPITSCQSLKRAAKHWVWNTSSQLSKHKPKCIQESQGGSVHRAKMIQVGQDSKCHLKSSTRRAVPAKGARLTSNH